MEITSINTFNNIVKNNINKIIVLKFTASWCGPCQRIKKDYQNLIITFPDIIFTEIDVDEMEKLSEHFEISCMPTFIFIKSHQNKYETVKKIEGANINLVKQTCNQFTITKNMESNNQKELQSENNISKKSPESYQSNDNYSDVNFNN